MDRYARQRALFDDAALHGARAAVIGAGGLGSPAALYLAGAGVGITLIDDDVVSTSNLHRQILHGTSAVGLPKVDSALARLSDLNPDADVRVYRERLTWDNAVDLLAGCDVVLDGSDNFATRHVVSHACARLGIPHVWGSILGFEAQVSVFWAGHGPVYEDLFPAPPPPGSVPSCSQAGVLGPVVGVAGATMAVEAIKLVAGLGSPLLGRLGYYDSLAGTWEYVPVVADPAVTERVRTAAPPAGPAEVDTVPPGAAVLDVREPAEFADFHLPGAVNVPLGDILAGTTPQGPAVVVCAGGVRSAQAVAALEDRGVTGLVSLRGGLDRLRELG